MYIDIDFLDGKIISQKEIPKVKNKIKVNIYNI